ncbi:MAG: DUF4037 domain-containing protein [Anaerovoracaceae bacterium]
MKGLALSRAYYDAFGSRILEAADQLDPGLASRLSIGLVGEGSQCFGYDDGISQDHDFAPGFCVFLSDADFQAFGTALQAVYRQLPDSFQGFTCENIIAGDRLGVMGCSEFYSRFTGVPETILDWLFLPESALAAATNGQIWQTGCSEFDSMRSLLSSFYPEDIRRKKIAARAAVVSQAGQYNLLRLIRREDEVAVLFAMSRFAEAAISMIHLLRRRYTPFYKWAFRSLSDMAETDPLADDCCRQLKKLPEVGILLRQGKKEEAESRAFQLTEIICEKIARELRSQHLSEHAGSFLQDHLTDIMNGIEDSQIRSMHPMADPAV